MGNNCCAHREIDAIKEQSSDKESKGVRPMQRDSYNIN